MRYLVIVTLYVAVVAGLAPTVCAHEGVQTSWNPERLADGQPDIQGMWDSTAAMFTPLEMPEDLLERDDVTREELQQRVDAKAKAQVEASEWSGHENSRGVGGYGSYWFDTYWTKPETTGARSIIIEPANGRIPKRLNNAQLQIDMNLAKVHHAVGNMDTGDRCISRGLLGMMMPTRYNNGTLILQPAGYVVIHSEMIHNARIIPIDVDSHLDTKVRLWEGDPRGHWEGNTLVIESTNFKVVKNIRAPNARWRSRQSERQTIVERITVAGPDVLQYSITIDDPGTYPKRWTAAFPFNRDDEYLQFEYSCHEGNYSVSSALGGARLEERSRGK